jgi:hypothetical protein
MRRRLLIMAVSVVTLLTVLCVAGAGRAWLLRGRELVMPGATDLQIDRRGAFHLNITYRYPAGDTLHDLTQHLVRQGWRRIRFPNSERNTLSFVRLGMAGRMREILVLTLDPNDHQLANLQFSRCVTVGSWFSCM